jgi:hypothetical protein
MTVIPEFPDAVSIQELSRQDYEAVLPTGEESSTVQWLHLKSWVPSARVSVFNRALVIEIRDYENPSSSCFTFCGGDDPAEVAWTLLHDLRMDKATTCLRLIPQSVVDALPAYWFECREDIDNNDYVYSTHATKQAEGRNFRRLRGILNTLDRKYGKALRAVSLPINGDTLRDMIEVGIRWLEESPYGIDPSGVDTTHSIDPSYIDYRSSIGPIGAVYSIAALRRCLESLESDPPAPGVLASGVYLEDQLVAFSIDEILTPSLAIGHFGYASHSVPGLSDLLHYQVVSTLSDMGVDWLNNEEDQGHLGLRRHKELQRPERFVRKYDVWEQGWLGWGWRRVANRLNGARRTAAAVLREIPRSPSASMEGAC